MLHELGHAVYDVYRDAELPWLLATPAHTCTTEAVAMFMGRLTRNAAGLQRYAGAGPEVLAATDAARRHDIRSTLVFIRWALVVVSFERELYRDPEQDLNALWWQLVSDLSG